ncbi:origin recognition complex subunit 2 [Nitzschia inconspicua]|uniref:Origin recognition complex subunit 2 n=1 Tax=Nitzschia inconspicua TaxID=303405 RepID=A0A9K3PUC8_9STRA|nr:origin recognition complex subunit 2 [Nitzschia inconspicua]
MTFDLQHNTTFDSKGKNDHRAEMNKKHFESMTDWFQKHASQEEADAMTALQLDYRFQGDNFGTMWWIHFQRLGFKHVERHYQLPTTTIFPEDNASNNNIISYPKKLYDANEIYTYLDALAIPQLTSAFDEMPRAATDDDMEIINHRVPSMKWWRTIRDELIFRNFRKDIEKECQLRKREHQTTSPPFKSSNKMKTTVTKNASSNDMLATTRSSQRLPTSLSTRSGAAQDAELYMVKSKKKRERSKGNRATSSREDDATPVEFLSLSEYARVAKHHQEQIIRNDPLDEPYPYSVQWEDWRFLVSTNHSLLLYGVGSKRHLLQRFAHDELDQDGDVVELDGYDKSITIEEILELLVDQWLEGKDPSVDIYHVTCTNNDDNLRNPVYPLNGENYLVQKALAVGKRIAAIVETSFRPIYLVLHTIDGPGLRNATAQEALSVLVSESVTKCGWNAIRLVASMEHVNAPTLLWDISTRQRFRWIWKEVHTHQPYVEEVLESIIAVESERHCSRKRLRTNKAGGGVALFNDEDPATQRESIFSVLKSLASRHTQALQQLSWLQLKSKKDWINYVDLLNQCRLKCVVTQDAQLRSYLGELMDHHIVIRNATQAASATSYRIPYPEDILELILDYEHDKV